MPDPQIRESARRDTLDRIHRGISQTGDPFQQSGFDSCRKAFSTRFESGVTPYSKAPNWRVIFPLPDDDSVPTPEDPTSSAAYERTNQ